MSFCRTTYCMSLIPMITTVKVSRMISYYLSSLTWDSDKHEHNQLKIPPENYHSFSQEEHKDIHLNDNQSNYKDIPQGKA